MRLNIDQDWMVAMEHLQMQNYRGYHLKPHEKASVDEIKGCLDCGFYDDLPKKIQHKKYLRHLIRRVEKALLIQTKAGDPSERLRNELDMLKDVYLEVESVKI